MRRRPRRATSSRSASDTGSSSEVRRSNRRAAQWFATASPATEEPLAEVAQAGPQDVDAAVGAAREAYENGLKRGELEAVHVLRGTQKGIHIKMIDVHPDLFEQTP